MTLMILDQVMHHTLASTYMTISLKHKNFLSMDIRAPGQKATRHKATGQKTTASLSAFCPDPGHP